MERTTTKNMNKSNKDEKSQIEVDDTMKPLFDGQLFVEQESWEYKKYPKNHIINLDMTLTEESSKWLENREIIYTWYFIDENKTIAVAESNQKLYTLNSQHSEINGRYFLYVACKDINQVMRSIGTSPTVTVKIHKGNPLLNRQTLSILFVMVLSILFLVSIISYYYKGIYKQDNFNWLDPTALSLLSFIFGIISFITNSE